MAQLRLSKLVEAQCVQYRTACSEHLSRLPRAPIVLVANGKMDNTTRQHAGHLACYKRFTLQLIER